MNTPSIPWHLLQSFVAISEAGSLSAGAARSGTSQPTLSRHLAQLEELLGARLFFRSAAGLTLTPEGATVQAHAQTMDEAAAQLSFAGAQAQDISGTVRITASQIAASYLLPPLLVGLRTKHPALSLEVVASDQSDNLLRREADLAVRMYRPTQNDLIAKKVADLPMGIFAARSYLARCGLPDSPENLSGHTVIGYDRSTLIIDGIADGHDSEPQLFRLTLRRSGGVLANAEGGDGHRVRSAHFGHSGSRSSTALARDGDRHNPRLAHRTPRIADESACAPDL